MSIRAKAAFAETRTIRHHPTRDAGGKRDGRGSPADVSDVAGSSRRARGPGSARGGGGGGDAPADVRVRLVRFRGRALHAGRAHGVQAAAEALGVGWVPRGVRLAKERALGEHRLGHRRAASGEPGDEHRPGGAGATRGGVRRSARASRSARRVHERRGGVSVTRRSAGAGKGTETKDECLFAGTSRRSGSHAPAADLAVVHPRARRRELVLRRQPLHRHLLERILHRATRGARLHHWREHRGECGRLRATTFRKRGAANPESTGFHRLPNICGRTTLIATLRTTFRAFSSHTRGCSTSTSFRSTRG